MQAITSGYDNAAYGYISLNSNTSGVFNTASGAASLQNNQTGNSNTAIGGQTLLYNTTGSYNTALGFNAGNMDSSGYFNTTPNLQNETAIGAYAQVQESNALVLGSVDTPTLVGIGTTVPLNTFSVSPLDYNTGTASQTSGSGTITGTGTTWTSAMVGDEMIFTDGVHELITAYVSATSLIGNSTVISESGVHYRLHHIGLQVMSSGKVCVAISSCSNTFGVQGTIGASGSITASTTPDLSETIPSAPNVHAYNVVSAGPDGKVDAVLSSTPYDPTALGIISDGSSSFKINAYGGNSSNPTGQYLVLAGRVPVYVTNEGGPIVPGDYLTTSSTPGYAMKADHAGPTIGKALGYFNGTSGTVMVQANLSYYDPTSGNYLQNGDSAQFNSLNVSGPTILSDLTVNGNETISQNLSVGGEITASSASITGALNVSGDSSFASITINGNIIISGHIITSGKDPILSPLAASGSGSSENVNGNDISGTITINTGSSPTTGDLVNLNFSNAYESTPHILVTPNNSTSASMMVYPDQQSQNGFDIGVAGTPKANTSYVFEYYVVQ